MKHAFIFAMAALVAVNPLSAEVKRENGVNLWKVNCKTHNSGYTQSFWVSGDLSQSDAEAYGRQHCTNGFESLARQTVREPAATRASDARAASSIPAN